RFFLARVWCVIGSKHIDDCVCDTAPDSRTMRRVANRRIHLRAGSEARVAVGRFKSEMMRRSFHRSHVLVAGEKLHFLQRRDVQDVHAGAGLMRDRDETLCRLERGNLVAPYRMRTGITFDTQILALIQSWLVFGME